MKRTPCVPESLAAEEQKMYDAVNNPLALSCVVTGVAFLEQSLISLLGKVLISCNTTTKLFDGILGTFRGCADLAYCLGLLPKGMYQSLVAVGEIRNLFAHSHGFLDFTSPEVAKLCKALTLPKVVSDKHPHSYYEEPRDRFVTVIIVLNKYLLAVAATTEKPERTTQEW